MGAHRAEAFHRLLSDLSLLTGTGSQSVLETLNERFKAAFVLFVERLCGSSSHSLHNFHFDVGFQSVVPVSRFEQPRFIVELLVCAPYNPRSTSWPLITKPFLFSISADSTLN